MVSQERKPGGGRRARLPGLHHVLADRVLSGGLVAHQQQHLPDSLRSPQRVFFAQAPDQLLDLQSHRLAACPRLPSPPRVEGPGVPAFHRFWLHDMDKFLPAIKEFREHHPEDSEAGAERMVPLPRAGGAIQFHRQLALKCQQLGRCHRPRQQQRPAEPESISQKLEQDTQSAAQVPEETQGYFHAHQDTRAPKREEALSRLGQHFSGGQRGENSTRIRCQSISKRMPCTRLEVNPGPSEQSPFPALQRAQISSGTLRGPRPTPTNPCATRGEGASGEVYDGNDGNDADDAGARPGLRERRGE